MKPLQLSGLSAEEHNDLAWDAAQAQRGFMDLDLYSVISDLKICLNYYMQCR